MFIAFFFHIAQVSKTSISAYIFDICLHFRGFFTFNMFFPRFALLGSTSFVVSQWGTSRCLAGRGDIRQQYMGITNQNLRI